MSGQQKDVVLYCKRCAFRVINCHMCRVCGSTKFYEAEATELLPEPTKTGEKLQSMDFSAVATLPGELWQIAVDEWLSFQSKVKEALQRGSVQSMIANALQKLSVQSKVNYAVEELSIQSKTKGLLQKLAPQGKDTGALQERSLQSKFKRTIGEISATAMNLNGGDPVVVENEAFDPALSQGLVRTRLNESLMKKLQR